MRPNYPGISDDQISVGRAIVEQLTETNRALVALASPTSPGSYSPTDVTGAASVMVDLPADADMVEIDLLSSPATAGVNLLARFRQNGVVISGATDYMWANLRGATSTNDGADPQMQINSSAGNSTGPLTLRLFRPNGPTGLRKYMTWHGGVLDNATGLPLTMSGVGRFMLNTDRIDGVQFFYSSGNFTSAILGVKYTKFTT